MITKLIAEFLRNGDWGELDVLVLDLPPGTGDVQLTLTQQVPITGGVIVTTPQDVALADVRRGIEMFQQVNAPVLGVIENMSYHLCPGCGARAEIFGHGGGAAMARELGVPFLGEMPLVRAVREAGDRGAADRRRRTRRARRAAPSTRSPSACSSGCEEAEPPRAGGRAHRPVVAGFAARSRAQRLEQHDRDADRDRRVGDVEHRPAPLAPVEVEEVDHLAVAHAADEVADARRRGCRRARHDEHAAMRPASRAGTTPAPTTATTRHAAGRAAGGGRPARPTACRTPRRCCARR